MDMVRSISPRPSLGKKGGIPPSVIKGKSDQLLRTVQPEGFDGRLLMVWLQSLSGLQFIKVHWNFQSSSYVGSSRRSPVRIGTIDA